jgi:hypothetical protein
VLAHNISCAVSAVREHPLISTRFTTSQGSLPVTRNQRPVTTMAAGLGRSSAVGGGADVRHS